MTRLRPPLSRSRRRPPVLPRERTPSFSELVPRRGRRGYPARGTMFDGECPAAFAVGGRRSQEEEGEDRHDGSAVIERKEVVVVPWGRPRKARRGRGPVSRRGSTRGPWQMAPLPRPPGGTPTGAINGQVSTAFQRAAFFRPTRPARRLGPVFGRSSSVPTLSGGRSPRLGNGPPLRPRRTGEAGGYRRSIES